MPKRKKPQESSKKGKKGNFAKIPFQKMPLDSMVGGSKSKLKSKGIFTAKRGQ